jgi:hypothetical protein
MKRLALAFALVLSTAGAALAQGAPASGPSKYRPPVTKIEIEDTKVTGDREESFGSIIYVPKRRPPSSLIKIRDNFLPEVITSTRDL